MADAFIRNFQELSIKDVTRELIGSYCWISPSQICIPGFPVCYVITFLICTAITQIQLQNS